MDNEEAKAWFDQLSPMAPVEPKSLPSNTNPYRLSKTAKKLIHSSNSEPFTFIPKETCLKSPDERTSVMTNPFQNQSVISPGIATSPVWSNSSSLSAQIESSHSDSITFSSSNKTSDSILITQFDALETKLINIVHQNIQTLNHKFESALVDLSTNVLQTMKAYHVHTVNDLVSVKVDISNQIQQSHQSVIDQQVQMISKFGDMFENIKTNSTMLSHPTSTTSIQSISTQTSNSDSSTKSVKSLQNHPVFSPPNSVAAEASIPNKRVSSNGRSGLRKCQASNTISLVKNTSPSELPHLCNSCKKPVTKTLKGIPYTKCQPCYLNYIGKSSKSKSSKSKTSKLEVKKTKFSNSTSRSHFGGQKSNDHTNRNFNRGNSNSTVNVNSVYNLTASNNSPQKIFQIPVNVTNNRKSESIKGILDLSRSTDIISLKACEDLGITHLLTKHNRPAGNYFGTLHAKLFINNVSYTSNFQVLKKSNSADIQIGSRFLRSNGLIHLLHNSSLNQPAEHMQCLQN